ncbi:hypothetical protein BBJ29_006529 [Phytophthora kernoviae]|uniref:Multidrug and toxin extrusion protein n=1 Tax=Phytophthora kernoviae TaxID=325452 RepID=A0A3F2RG35_9STRA|nr:hypothetical protein BBP00_00008235 [Phytophthora kernoviae]RLN68484.1 hypothetical protein BBJ29_006529 [Phytophthora kernoviae]
MGMILANVGEDDGSSAGESGGDSSGGSSGNSGLIRNHAHKIPTPSAAVRTKDQSKRRVTKSADESGIANEKSRRDAKSARKTKLQPLTLQDAKPKKKSTMTRQLTGYDEWEKPVVVHKPIAKSRRAAEEAPLLQSAHAYDAETDIESGILLEELNDSESKPEIKTELDKLFKLSYPVIFTYVLEFFPEIVSMTLVGHLDSPLTKQYLDGVALSTMCMNLTAIGVGFGLATAMDTLCSQAYGAGKPKKLGIYLQSGLIVLGIAMIPVFLINWYTEAFLLMLGQPAQVVALAGRFSRILLPGIPFMFVYEMIKKVMQAQNVVLPMVYIAVFSNVVNLVLGVYLVFYTSLGFDGAAIARLVSEFVLPLALVPYYMRNPHIPAEWWSGWQLKEAMHHLGTFLTLGIPGMFMMLLEWWSFEIMAAIVGWLPHSVVSISVHSVLVNVSTMAFNVFLGISVAANVLVGNYSGSNQPNHAKMASTLGMLLSVSVSAVLAVIIIATRYYIPEVFINDAVAISLTGHALLFLMPYQMCDALNAVMQGVFRGTGRLMLGAYINLIAYFVIGLPCGVYLAFCMDLGVEGMWLGLTVGIFFGCVVSLVKILETNWKGMADAARVRTS